MFGHLIAKLTVFALRSKRLSGNDKALVTTALLDNLQAINIKDIIKIDEQGIRINGRQLETEQAIQLRESVIQLQNSYARKVIREQVAYEAIKMGIHNGLNPDMILFAKAALWYDQAENQLIQSISE